MTTGYAFSYPGLELDKIKGLWQAVFKHEAPALCFNGLISHYELGANNDEPPGSFANSMSGSAFNQQLELRWKQIEPQRYKVLVLTEMVEMEKLLPELDVHPTTYLVLSGREAGKEILAQPVLQGFAIVNKEKGERVKVERRIPRAINYPLNLSTVSYLYYQDLDSRQVKFIRLKGVVERNDE